MIRIFPKKVSAQPKLVAPRLKSCINAWAAFRYGKQRIYEEATNQETAAEELNEDIEQVQHNVAGLVQSWEK